MEKLESGSRLLFADNGNSADTLEPLSRGIAKDALPQAAMNSHETDVFFGEVVRGSQIRCHSEAKVSPGIAFRLVSCLLGINHFHSYLPAQFAA